MLFIGENAESGWTLKSGKDVKMMANEILHDNILYKSYFLQKV